MTLNRRVLHREGALPPARRSLLTAMAAMPADPFVCACGTPIPGNNFCPVCGRRAARLDAAGPLTLSLPSGVGTVEIMLRKAGPGALPYRASVRGEGLSIVSGVRETLVQSPRRIVIAVAPGAEERQGTLVVETANAERAGRWWERDVYQAVEIPLRIARAVPARPAVPARVLLFPDGAPEQGLALWNEGDEPAAVKLAAPAGCTVQAGAVTLPARGGARVAVRCAGRREGSLRVAWPGGSTEVALQPVEPRRAGGPQPAIAVAVDFGTANTSVRVRDLRSGAERTVGPDDPRRPGEPMARFPSVMWVGARGGVEIGPAAQARTGSEDGGFLVRGIKTLMRRGEDPYTRFGAEYTTGRLLALCLAELKRLIDRALRAIGEPDGGQVMYTFCLPVLDNGPRYRAQEERMRTAALEAGFPVNEPGGGVFVAEPVAAALAAARWLERATGLAPGSRLCVVDSGGGTTDVTLGEVVIDERGRYAFRPDSVASLHPPAYPAVESLRALQGARAPEAEPELGGDTYDALLLERWIRDGKLPAEPWEAFWPGAAYEGGPEARPSLSARLTGVLEGVRGLKEDLCGADLFMGIRLDADTVRARFGCASGDPAVEAALDANAHLLFPIAAALDYDEDVAPVARDVWREPGVGPALKAMAAAAGKLTGVVAVGGCNGIPAQRAECRAWAGADLLEVGDRDGAVVEGALLACDYYPSGTLPFRLLVRMAHGAQVATRTLLPAYRRMDAVSPVRKAWELAPGESLCVEVLADEQTLASHCLTARERMQVTVRTERDPVEDIRLEGVAPPAGSSGFRVVIEQAGRAWPFWEVRV